MLIRHQSYTALYYYFKQWEVIFLPTPSCQLKSSNRYGAQTKDWGGCTITVKYCGYTC